MAGVNIQIERNERENNLSILRRFRNRVRSSGILMKARSLRYHTRPQSEFQKKQSKLRRLTKSQERERLIKLGKIGE